MPQLSQQQIVSHCHPAGYDICTTMEITLAQTSLTPDVHDITITNPSDADCSIEESHSVEILPAPVLDLESNMECLEQGDNLSFWLEKTSLLLMVPIQLLRLKG